MKHFLLCVLGVAVGSSPAFADEPATSYVFPAGGQRGTTVEARVGGMNLSGGCGFRMVGPGVEAPSTIRERDTLILPGPYHQNPIAQQAFDYPKDHAAAIRIAPDAAPGVRYWYCTTSEGATQLRCFVIGDLPEVLEEERKTLQGRPQQVALPLTVNGRIYPRGDLDEYEFAARAGDVVTGEVLSQRLGHKLDARLELFDPSGRPLVTLDGGSGPDPLLIATIPADGRYVLRIHDLAYEGNQDYVYRLTLRIGPSITHLFPAGGRRGEPGRVRLYGAGLSPEGFVDRELDPSTLPVSSGFQLGDLPEVIEAEGSAQRISIPTVVNGQILAPGDVDEFVFAATKGQKLDLELFGRRLGSPITAVVAVLDGTGKPLLRQAGDGAAGFTAPADGDYTLRVQEAHRETHGGTEYVYRLVVAPPRPAFRLALEKETLVVLPGQSSKIKLNVARTGGFAGDLDLEFLDLPPGVQAAPKAVAAAAKQVEVTFTASPEAPIGETRRVSVVGGATLEGRRVTRPAQAPVVGSVPGQPAAETLAVTVAHPPLFTIETEEVYGFANRGTAFAQKFTVTRLAGFDGDLELGIADRQARYLQGATGPTIVVRAGEKDAVYPAFLPESMDLNRTARIVLTGTARVKDASGRLHAVTYTTKKQIVVRVSPSLLTVSAEQEEIEARPGQEVLVALRLARTRDLSGPAAVEAILPEGSRGVVVRPVDAAEDQETVRMTLQLAPGAAMGEDGRVVFRATGRRNGQPVLSETAVRFRLEPPR